MIPKKWRGRKVENVHKKRRAQKKEQREWALKLQTYIALRVQLDEILFALETQLSNLGPGKGVDFGEVLEDKHSHVCNCQVQRNSLVVLKDISVKMCKNDLVNPKNIPSIHVLTYI